MNILAGSNTEGNFMPLFLPLRAQAFRQCGNLNLAMEDYKKLYQSGNTAVLDSMRDIFNQCSLKQKTFNEFIASFKPGVHTTSSDTRQQAPDFTGTDLHGKIVHLSDFKGKLVVLNIWGIGCGPCVAKMPQLNDLVKQYSERKDIVFLAITADKTANLNKFLKSKRFDYTILNNVNNITEKFNTNALPVHMVIGRDGDIISRSIGAREDIKDYLKQAINSNL
jgi:peroxiredoxin